MSKWDAIECETMHYGAFDTGTRTIYKTLIPLWEETITSGHRILGQASPPIWTAFPKRLPDCLPQGAAEMGVDTGNGGYAWVTFKNEAPAFEFAMKECSYA